MPLNAASLQSALEELFAAPPSSAAHCAQAWSDAALNYASSIVPPSVTIAAAASTLASALAAAFETPDAGPQVDSAFASFAATIGTGMAPAHTAVPPAAPLGIANLLASAQPTHAAAAAAFAGAIDAWFRTGTATLVAPPNTVLPWT